MRGGALGDFLLTLPAICALAQNFPRATIGLIVPPSCLGLARLAFPSSDVHRVDHPELAPFFSSGSDLPGSWRNFFREQDLIVSYLSDPKEIFRHQVGRISPARFLAGPFKITDGKHAAAQLAAPFAEFGLTLAAFRFAPSAVVARRIVIHPSSGAKRKNWPVSRWIEFIGCLREETLKVTIVGGEADEKEIAELRARFPQLDFQIDQPLEALIPLFSESIFLGHDTGVSHLAAMSGARCLLLFGPTNSAIWAPSGENITVLTVATGRMEDLKLAEVLAAYELMRIGIST